MKNFVFILLVLIVSQLLKAEKVGWQTDFKAAEQEAIESDRLLLLYFTGSDWCQWCLKLDNELFADPLFRKEISGFAVPVFLDFPNRPLPPHLQRQNNRLKAQLKVEAIPEVVLYDPAKKEVLWRHGYVATDTGEYLKLIRQFGLGSTD